MSLGFYICLLNAFTTWGQNLDEEGFRLLTIIDTHPQNIMLDGQLSHIIQKKMQKNAKKKNANSLFPFYLDRIACFPDCISAVSVFCVS